MTFLSFLPKKSLYVSLQWDVYFVFHGPIKDNIIYIVLSLFPWVQRREWIYFLLVYLCLPEVYEMQGLVKTYNLHCHILISLSWGEEWACKIRGRTEGYNLHGWTNWHNKFISIDIPGSSVGDLFRLLLNCFLLFCSEIDVLLYLTLLADI